jgi:hypothetical protein
MDFTDSPGERAFRHRLRDWLADHNPGLPAASAGETYRERGTSKGSPPMACAASADHP